MNLLATPLESSHIVNKGYADTKATLIPITLDEFNNLTDKEKNDPTKMYVFTDYQEEQQIDDSSVSLSTLWSSSKVNSEVSALIDDINNMSTELNEKITQLNTLLGTKAVINDNSTDTTSTWSGSKINSSISSLTNTINSKAAINDSVTNMSTTWSGSKINNTINSNIGGGITLLYENITAEGTYTLSQSIRNFNYIVVTALGFGNPISPFMFPAKLEKKMLIHLYNQSTFIGRAIFPSDNTSLVTIDNLSWTSGINIYGVM